MSPEPGWSDAAKARAAGVPLHPRLLASGSDDDGEDDTGWLIAGVERTAVMLGAAEGEATRLREQRDEAIRLALGAGLSYRRVGEASGLSRPMLDVIRRSGTTTDTHTHTPRSTP